MSMHKIPLTPLEEAGLRAHGLDIGTPSQLSDVFRQGVAYALAADAARGTMREFTDWLDARRDLRVHQVFRDLVEWQASRAAAPQAVPNSRPLSEVIAEYEAKPEMAAALAEARANLKAAAPQSVEPVAYKFVNSNSAAGWAVLVLDQSAWEKAGHGTKLYLAPPTAPTDAEWEVTRRAQVLSAPLVRAAINLLAAVDQRHDNEAPPLKYSIPYGAVNELRAVLGVDLPAPPTKTKDQP